MKFSLTCCATAKQQLEMKCEQHGFDCPDQVLRYIPESDAQYPWFALVAGNANYKAKFCPWCGETLHVRNIPSIIMDTVALKKIPEQKVSIYHRDEFVGKATYIELQDLRIQIKNNEATDWKVVYDGKIIPIDTKGNVTEWPNGMFDLIDEQLDQLINW